MKSNIWIFPLERLNGARYTDQWYDYIPILLEQYNNHRYNIHSIGGSQKETTTTQGAFLNFSDTNYWKSTQLCNFILEFEAGNTTPNDKFLITDIWNPAILQLKYMSDLLDQKWEIHTISHAGAFDPSDILGYKMEKPWPYHAERAFFHAGSFHYFGTEFQRNMFLNNLEIPREYHSKAIRSGQPHGAWVPTMEAYQTVPKQNKIIWPHRYNDDKQPAIAEDLSNSFDMIISQKHNLSKDDYYRTLSECKIIFSCALHENLGISVMEAVLGGSIPVLPNRCSYQEMYYPEFLYPSEWTQDYNHYRFYRNDLIEFIEYIMNNSDKFANVLAAQQARLKTNYTNADIMVRNILG